MSPNEASENLLSVLGMCRIVPVVEIDDVESAAPLAETLVEAGIPVIEVVLRTSAAMESIGEMSRVKGCTVGAGSVVSRTQLENAAAVGAKFIVSPGSTDELIDMCSSMGIPFLPGAATATEILRLMGTGFRLFKFFPAEILGGTAALKALSGPISAARFCPTGGIGNANFLDYLSLANVSAVGGSWIAPRQLVKAQDWKKISRLAADAVGRSRGV